MAMFVAVTDNSTGEIQQKVEVLPVYNVNLPSEIDSREIVAKGIKACIDDGILTLERIVPPILSSYVSLTNSYPTTIDVQYFIWAVYDSFSQSAPSYPTILNNLKRKFHTPYNNSSSGRAFRWSPALLNLHLCTQPY